MKRLWYHLVILWHRISGDSAVQAEWKAKRALEKPDEIVTEIRTDLERAQDTRFFCVCNQMLVAGDRVCPSCGRRQYVPYWLRSVLRVGRSLIPGELPGTALVAALIGLSFLMQLKVGSGGIMNPNDTAELFDLGASFPFLTVGPQPWRAFTYTCLHGGLMHVAFNVIVLIQIGPLVERTFGSARFLAAWVVTGALAAIIPVFVTGGSLVIGASGAVFGLMGMALIYGHQVGTQQGREIRDVMIRWTIYTTIFGFMMGGVAHSAHFAGLGAGILFGFVAPPPLNHPGRKRASPWLALGALAAMVWALGSFGSWVAEGAMPPDRLSERDSQRLYFTLERARGAEAYVGERGRSLIERARTLRREGLPPDQVAAIERETVQLGRAMVAGQRLILYRAVNSALFPNGRPRTTDRLPQ